jgi:hypothetical protein
LGNIHRDVCLLSGYDAFGGSLKEKEEITKSGENGLITWQPRSSSKTRTSEQTKKGLLSLTVGFILEVETHPCVLRVESMAKCLTSKMSRRGGRVVRPVRDVFFSFLHRFLNIYRFLNNLKFGVMPRR